MPSVTAPPEAASALAGLRGFLFDLDGTLYLGERLLEGALELLAFLQASGRSYAYVTNNSSHSTRDCLAKAARLGIGVEPERLITSGGAAVEYLRERGLRRVYALGTPSLVAELAEGGMNITAQGAQAVVLGMDLTLTYAKLEQACHLVRAGAAFVATHPDLNCPMPQGPVPDCGALSAVVTAATGVEPVVIGKPHAPMLKTALGRLGTSAGETCIVGDRLYTDMELGFRGGLRTALVLTGEATWDLARRYHRMPDWVVPSVGDLMRLLARADGAR